MVGERHKALTSGGKGDVTVEDAFRDATSSTRKEEALI